MAKQHCKVSNADCKSRETHQKEGISRQIIKWAKGNDWYRIDIQTNQLRLERAFGGPIEAIAKDLDYQNQNRMSRDIYDLYDLLSAKCRKIDLVCRAGCQTEGEMYDLHILRIKTIATATELAEMLYLLQRTQESMNTGTQENVDSRPPYQRGGLRGNDTSAGSVQANDDEWITFTQAAEMLAVTKGTVSKWAAEGKFQDNGRTGQKRRLLTISVLMVKQKIEDQAIKGDIKELREDARKLKTTKSPKIN